MFYLYFISTNNLIGVSRKFSLFPHYSSCLYRNKDALMPAQPELLGCIAWRKWDGYSWWRRKTNGHQAQVSNTKNTPALPAIFYLLFTGLYLFTTMPLP